MRLSRGDLDQAHPINCRKTLRSVRETAARQGDFNGVVVKDINEN